MRRAPTLVAVASPAVTRSNGDLGVILSAAKDPRLDCHVERHAGIRRRFAPQDDVEMADGGAPLAPPTAYASYDGLS